MQLVARLKRMDRCQRQALTTLLNWTQLLRHQIRYLTTACAGMYIPGSCQSSEWAARYHGVLSPGPARMICEYSEGKIGRRVSQPAVCGTIKCDSHPWDRSLTLQSMANLRASMSAELRSLVVSKPNTKLSSFLGCQKIACGAASPPPLTPHSWKQIAGIRSEYSLCFRIPATYNELSRSELLQVLEVVPTEYLHRWGIEFLCNDRLSSSESHPKSPNAKNMKRICRLSNSIH